MIKRLSQEVINELMKQTTPTSLKEVESYFSENKFTDENLQTIKDDLTNEVEKFPDYEVAQMVLQTINKFLSDKVENAKKE
jgi:hypothetical protein